MKRIMLYCILIVVILFTGCGKETAEAPTTVQETILVTEESKEANSQQIEAIVQEFANAYFSADSDTMKRHLSSSNKADFTVYSEGEPSEVVVHAIKGLDNAAKDIVEKGYCSASVEFKKSADSDYYLYLSITLIQEDEMWKISDYGLEM